MDKRLKQLREAYGAWEQFDRVVTLYRGLEGVYDSNYDLSLTDASTGYSTWTDNPDLAREYAGKSGYVYKIDLPVSELRDEYIDADGERALFFNNEKKAGLSGRSGHEYLVYLDHELYNSDSIQLHSGPISTISS